MGMGIHRGLCDGPSLDQERQLNHETQEHESDAERDRALDDRRTAI
jgi:hypothetical protein